MGVNETGTITLRLMAQDLASGNIGKFIGHMDQMAKKGGLMGSVMQGVGQSFGQMLNPMMLATRAIGAVTDFMMDATKAAAEDEKSQAQLTQTLINNVPQWDRYAGAIEQATETALGLAFADDEVRGSLNLLIPRTKDVTEALKLNSLAMDLARFKNISLEEAATLVGKAYSGQVSALKRAGVAITETKDSTKALAQLQGIVAGQATTYAGTAEGSYKTLDLTIQELTESVGYELLPALKDLAGYVRSDVIPNIDELVHGLQDTAQWSLLAAGVLQGNLTQSLAAFGELTDTEMKKLTVPAPGTIKFFDPIVKSAETAADDIAVSARRIKAVPFQVLRSLDDVKGDWIAGWKNLASWAKDPFKPEDFQNWIKRRAKKAAANAAQAAADGKGEVRRNWTAIAKAARSPVTAALVAMGQDVDEAIAKVMAIQALAKRIDPLAIVVTGAGLGNNGNPVSRPDGSGGIEARASGGPVYAGRTYRVGENGEETLHMGRNGNGFVVPNGGGNGGGTTVIVHFHSVATPTEADGERIAASIGPALTRWQRRQGVVR